MKRALPLRVASHRRRRWRAIISCVHALPCRPLLLPHLNTLAAAGIQQFRPRILVPPRILPPVFPPRRVFPFGLRRKPLPRPRTVGPRLLVVHAVDRMLLLPCLPPIAELAPELLVLIAGPLPVRRV